MDGSSFMRRAESKREGGRKGLRSAASQRRSESALFPDDLSFSGDPRPESPPKKRNSSPQGRLSHAVFLPPLHEMSRPVPIFPCPQSKLKIARAPMALSFPQTKKSARSFLQTDVTHQNVLKEGWGARGEGGKTFSKVFLLPPASLPSFYSVPNSYCSSLSRMADRIMAMTPETTAAADAGTSVTSLFSRRRKNTEGHSCVFVLTRGST